MKFYIRFKTALKKFFKKQQKAVIFFERNYRTMHMQIQVVPVPASQASAAKPTFQVKL
jgi:Protein similar to CwfJ C-terminus 1